MPKKVRTKGTLFPCGSMMLTSTTGMFMRSITPWCADVAIAYRLAAVFQRDAFGQRVADSAVATVRQHQRVRLADQTALGEQPGTAETGLAHLAVERQKGHDHVVVVHSIQPSSTSAEHSSHNDGLCSQPSDTQMSWPQPRQ